MNTTTLVGMLSAHPARSILSALGHHVAQAGRRALRRRRADAPRAHDAAFEAAEVRAMAELYRKVDPGFAADLYAAADRHELEAEARITLPR